MKKLTKLLTLCRHAKSSWKYDVDDVYRPLNRRGITDAPAMAKRWPGLKPERILCSPAVRTYATALAYVCENDWPMDILKLTPALLHAGHTVLLEEIRQTENSVGHLMLVGHNPGLEDLFHFLSKNQEKLMVTSAIAHLKCDISDWSELTPEAILRGAASYARP